MTIIFYLQKQILSLQNQKSTLEKNLAVSLQKESSMQKQILEFENFSAKIFEEARNKFEFSNKNQLDMLLSPLKENLKGFEKKIEELNIESIKKQTTLETHINRLAEMNNSLSKEATNLTNALKNDNKSTGNWGEVILEKVLESCGLTEGIEFFREQSFTTEDGVLRPDVIIKLPQDKSIIIDSKVSLVSYEKFCNSQNEEISSSSQKEFLNSIKNHIDGLSRKNYENLKSINSPDFVLMFIPIEPAFILLGKTFPQIFDYAFNKKIILVAPATLLATLKTVELIWRNDKQQKNTLEIARVGGILYDKISTFVDKFLDLQKKVSNLSKDCDDIFTTLSVGKGNVLTTAEKLKELGAKTKKNLDKNLLESSNEEPS